MIMENEEKIYKQRLTNVPTIQFEFKNGSIAVLNSDEGFYFTNHNIGMSHCSFLMNEREFDRYIELLQEIRGK